MASKVKKREKRMTAVYWVMLILYAAVLFAAIYYFLADRWKYAEEYERAQPTHAIDAYMSTLNADRWNSTMENAAVLLSNDFQTPEECVGIVKSSLQGEFLKRKIETGEMGKMSYDIICGGRKIGTVHMQEDVLAVTEYDQHPWKVTGDEYNFDYLLTSASATAPASYVVKLNDKPIGESYISEQGIHYDVLEQYYEDYQGLPTKVVYNVSGLVGEVQPVVYDEQGEVFTYNEELNDSQYITPCSMEELAALKAFTDAFIDPYAQYFGTKWVDSNYGSLIQYVKRGSELENIMKGFQDGASWIHTYSIVLNNYEFKGAFKLGGGFYVIEAQYETTAYADYKTVNEDVPLKVIVLSDETGIHAVAIA